MNKSVDRKKLHEIYHRETKSQYKIIGQNNFTHRNNLAEIEKYLKRGMKVLDIGCGAGTVDFYLADKGFNVTGIDISDIAIKSCLQTKKILGDTNTKFHQSYFPKDKIKEKYDFIILSEVIEHLEDDNSAIKEIYKLLKPKGILFLSTPSINAPLHKLGLTEKFDKEVGHVRRYSSTGLSKLIKDNGFKVIKIKNVEGIFRNFLFVNPIAGKFVRFIKFFLSDVVTFIDNLTIPLLGESNYIVVARKN